MQIELDDPDLSPVGAQAVDVAVRMIAAIDADLVPLRAELTAFGRRHPGPRELSHEYALGALLATMVWEELSDTRRSPRLDKRCVTPYWTSPSMTPTARTVAARAHPPRTTSAALALYEALHAHKKTSPDNGYYLRLAHRIGGVERAVVARKLARRCHHQLRALGDQAWI